ncbi:MAG: hypothetical protein O3B73_15920 [bacterium]|nr:hypothetical protein [bacterium]
MVDSRHKKDREIERALGLYAGAGDRWRRGEAADPINAFPGTGHQKLLEAEVGRLHRELDVVREERDIPRDHRSFKNPAGPQWGLLAYLEGWNCRHRSHSSHPIQITHQLDQIDVTNHRN